MSLAGLVVEVLTADGAYVDLVVEETGGATLVGHTWDPLMLGPSSQRLEFAIERIVRVREY